MWYAGECDFAAKEVDVLGAALAHPHAGGDDFIEHVLLVFRWLLRLDGDGKQGRRRDGGREKSTK
jgi:hypothetical protein